MNLKDVASESLLRAIQVVEAIDYNNFWVECYSNGREQGLSLKDKTTGVQVNIAEFRRTDDIVVYYGKFNDFHPFNNDITEDVYRNQIRFFRTASGAAEFCESCLRDSDPIVEIKECQS